MIITPTIGRQLWFFHLSPFGDKSEVIGPYAATVCATGRLA